MTPDDIRVQSALHVGVDASAERAMTEAAEHTVNAEFDRLERALKDLGVNFSLHASGRLPGGSRTEVVVIGRSDFSRIEYAHFLLDILMTWVENEARAGGDLNDVVRRLGATIAAVAARVQAKLREEAS